MILQVSKVYWDKTDKDAKKSKLCMERKSQKVWSAQELQSSSICGTVSWVLKMMCPHILHNLCTKVWHEFHIKYRKELSNVYSVHAYYHYLANDCIYKKKSTGCHVIEEQYSKYSNLAFLICRNWHGAKNTINNGVENSVKTPMPFLQIAT
jgi:hypothetical protein